MLLARTALFLGLNLRLSVFTTPPIVDVMQEVTAQAVPFSDIALAAEPVTVYYGITSVRCSSECAKVECASFNYNKEIRICELLDTYVCEDVVALETRKGFRYYDVIIAEEIQPMEDYSSFSSCINHGRCSYKCYETTSSTITSTMQPPTTMPLTTTQGPNEVLIYDDCSTETPCTVPFSECGLDGYCKCLAGYSFKPYTGECVTTCDTPGDSWGFDFTHTPGYYIFSNNLETFLSCDLNCCMDKCVSYATATCKSIDHNSELNKCYVSGVTKLEILLYDWYQSAFYDYYQRNCA